MGRVRDTHVMSKRLQVLLEDTEYRKLAVVREAARHAYPAGDVDSMLAEIERGYGVGAPVEPDA